MLKLPPGMNAFEFVVLSALRVGQLKRGCTPRVEGFGKVGVIAQREVSEQKVLPVRPAATPLAGSNATPVLPPQVDVVQS